MTELSIFSVALEILAGRPAAVNQMKPAQMKLTRMAKPTRFNDQVKMLAISSLNSIF